MKKRIVFKKGKYVTTRKGPAVLALSKRLLTGLKPLSKKIEIVGSIRRKEPKPVDIDLVLIPKDKQKIVSHLSKKGKYLQGGQKRVTFRIQGVKVEIYFSRAENWGAMLLSYTGPQGSSIGLRSIAKDKGLLLNQYGLYNRKTKHRIAGKTEQGIYKALGKKWKLPEKR